MIGALTAGWTRGLAVLGRLSMYRLVLASLGALTIVALVLSLFGLVGPRPLELLATAAVLAAVCLVVDAIAQRILRLPVRIESSLITAAILLFVLFHLAHYTFAWVHGAELSDGKVVNYLDLKDAKGRHDVYSMLVAGFTTPWLCVFYIVTQLLLFVHLRHGIQSAFQTLGLKNKRFRAAIGFLGLAAAGAILIGNLFIVCGVWAGLAPPVR